jgi:hypothetical protein
MNKRNGTQRIIHNDPRWLARQPRRARVLPPNRAEHDHTEEMWIEVDPQKELRPAALQDAIGQLSTVSKLSLRLDGPQAWIVATGSSLRIADFRRALSAIGISAESWFLFAAGSSRDAHRTEAKGGSRG